MITVERRFYESGYADYALYVEGERRASVTVQMVAGVARLSVETYGGALPGVCPDGAERLANTLIEAAQYAAGINRREEVTCDG